MADIFVSYKREDRDTVAPLARILEAQGWSVWWDPAIVPGERYQAVIDLALNEAKCVIVVWSPQSTGSHWVLDEAGKGRDRGILVPVLIDGAIPPLGFGQYQAVDLAKWSGRPDDPRLGQLFAGVLRVLSGKPPAQYRPTSVPSHAPQAGRRRAGNIWAVALAGVAVVALLTAAAIYWGGIPYGDLANAKRDGSLGASQEGWSLGGDYIKFYPSSGPGACRVDCDAIPAACRLHLGQAGRLFAQ